MATQTFTGNAPTIAQITSWTFGGTWLSTETITLTIGTKAVTFLTGSTAIATILANLCANFATLDSTIYPEFTGDIVATNDSSVTFVATAVNAGVPFTLALSTNSASGTIGAPGATRANSGPNDWSTAANWSTGSVPVSSDTVWISTPNTAIYYGFAQSAVLLTAMNVTVPATIGLPSINANGYFEYRATYLAIGCTTITFFTNVGTGSCFFQLDPGSHTTTVDVFGMGTPGGPGNSSTGNYALALKGGGSNYTLNLQQGIIGVAVNTGETATLPTINVSYENNVSSDVSLTLGSGCTTTTINQFGGSILSNASVTTWTMSAGSGTITGAATITTLTLFPAAQQTSSMSYQSTGTITTLTVGPRATFEAQKVSLARTVTNTTFYAGSTILDGETTVTFTNKPFFACDFNSECTIVRGSNRSVGI